MFYVLLSNPIYRMVAFTLYPLLIGFEQCLPVEFRVLNLKYSFKNSTVIIRSVWLSKTFCNYVTSLWICHVNPKIDWNQSCYKKRIIRKQVIHMINIRFCWPEFRTIRIILLVAICHSNFFYIMAKKLNLLANSGIYVQFTESYNSISTKVLKKGGGACIFPFLRLQRSYLIYDVWKKNN